jgi:antitoxin component YwqK of YwqJK toxin-antitoxin module
MTQYYYDGRPKYSQEYMNGIKHGNYTHWYINVRINSTGSYHMGNRIGKWKWFDEKGNKLMEIDYKIDYKRL